MIRIFVTLLTMSIGAAWLILIVLFLRLLLRQAPKWVNCVLWGFAALRLVCPYVPESRFSLMPGVFRMQNRYGSAADLTLAQTPVIVGNPTQNVIEGAGAAGLTGIPTGAGTVATGFGGELFQQILSVGSILWLIGVLVMLGYAVYSYLRVRRQVSEAIWLRDNLWICDQVKSPFILGLFRPKIYLSSGMEEAQLPYVIAHEQAHLRRGDQWWKPLGFVLLMIHWYNPFVWVAYILFCRDLELACDESAVRDLTLEERKSYSYALLSWSMQRRLVTVCPLAFGEVGVKKRVKEVLNYKKPSFWILLAAVVVCVIVAVCFLTNPKDGTTVVLTNEAGNSEADAATDAAPEKLGSLESGGTAYPLSSGADGIYVTSGHSIEVYTIDAANGKLGLARSNTEVYDENGNATYYRLDDQGQTVESTEEEYIKEWDIYSKVASPIEFTVQK